MKACDKGDSNAPRTFPTLKIAKKLSGQAAGADSPIRLAFSNFEIFVDLSVTRDPDDCQKYPKNAV